MIPTRTTFAVKLLWMLSSVTGPPPDTANPELMRGVLLALALGDDSVGGAEAAELADRALPLTTGDGALDPRAALEAAKSGD